MKDKRQLTPAVTGTGFQTATFIPMLCTHDQKVTPHSAGKVLSRDGVMIEVELRCRICGLEVIYATDQLPDGYQIYHIRVTGEDGPHLPAEFRPLAYIEEEFEVVGNSLQDAHERAEFACTLRFQGHRTTWFIDGATHLDERF
ncbi:hypothetical protein [Hymenobacter perfusus]|uniref:Uncharacterized protein n=1 Tax=Hymenobacter perfusus TaxID=1236770 RepID=A0A428JXW2_9BACT|nr:hypothetical protein [Hymenobacter perfusus]RSK38984.1 hypothetical protein EI293_20905 [Hymenobacter perfusus]